MARILTAYWPGSSRAAGKLKRPLSSVATVVVMGEPTFLTLITTPSIRPSLADDTVPDSAAAGWLCACAAPAGRMSASTVAIRERCFANMFVSFVASRDLCRWSVQRLELDDRGAVV